MEDVEEIDTCCARRVQPSCGKRKGTKAVALNILIKVDKQKGNGEQITCNVPNKVKCKEKRQKSPCKKSKKKECCNSGYDNFMPPPPTPNCQMLPCGCVVVYDDPRNKTNAEIQCGQCQPEKSCKGNQYNACISSSSQTAIKEQSCSNCNKEKRACTNNACQTSGEGTQQRCTKGKSRGQCKTTGCQASEQSSNEQNNKQKMCGPSKSASCQTCVQSHKPRLCGACSNNNCNHCARSNQPNLCVTCASSGSLGSNRKPCHKTTSECQTHATCIPKTKEHMSQAKGGDYRNKDRSKTQISREQSDQRMGSKVQSKTKIETQESKVQTCPPIEVVPKMDRSVQSFYSSTVMDNQVAPYSPSPQRVMSKAPSQKYIEELQAPLQMNETVDYEEEAVGSPPQVNTVKSQQLPLTTSQSKPVNIVRSQQLPPTAPSPQQLSKVPSQQVPSKDVSYYEQMNAVQLPSKAASPQQSKVLSLLPSKAPSPQQLSKVPSQLPSKASSPQQMSKVPSQLPSQAPSPQQMSKVPSQLPSQAPSPQQMSKVPSQLPSQAPSPQQMSKVPSQLPSQAPSPQQMSKVPSQLPSQAPSPQQLSKVPSQQLPSKDASYYEQDNVIKSQLPSKAPSPQQLSKVPSQLPSTAPSPQQLSKVPSQLPSAAPSPQQLSKVPSQQLPSKDASNYEQMSLVRSQQLSPEAVSPQQMSQVPSQQLPSQEASYYEQENVIKSQLPLKAPSPQQMSEAPSQQFPPPPPSEVTNALSYIQELEPSQSWVEEVEEENDTSQYDGNRSSSGLYENSEETEEACPNDEDEVEEACINDDEDCEDNCDNEDGECTASCDGEDEYGDDVCGFGVDSWAWDSWNRFVSLVNGEPIPNPCLCRSEDTSFNQTMESPDLEYGSIGSTVGGLLRTDMMSEDTCILLVALPLVVLSLMASFKGC